MVRLWVLIALAKQARSSSLLALSSPPARTARKPTDEDQPARCTHEPRRPAPMVTVRASRSSSQTIPIPIKRRSADSVPTPTPRSSRIFAFPFLRLSAESARARATGKDSRPVSQIAAVHCLTYSNHRSRRAHLAEYSRAHPNGGNRLVVVVAAFVSFFFPAFLFDFECAVADERLFFFCFAPCSVARVIAVGRTWSCILHLTP